MIRTTQHALRIALLFIFFGANAQVKPPAPYGALPSTRQLAWHELDMYVLVHFTPTTFENKEWGYGDADPKIFNPSDFSADQIVAAAKSGGFKGLIFVSKHHDGFCLWPTKTTPYNISQSPWKDGKGDMVGEFARAAKAAGLKFGVYCSPWDRNNPQYGTYEYVKTYRAQLKELYTRYGPLFMSWHDGANGGDGYYGGKKETRSIDRSTYYGWDTTWSQLTRKLQPTANIFSDAGWDVRWVGNEDGAAEGESWATFTPRPASGGTKVGPGMVDYSESPMGTKHGKYWMPAECDVALRPGWFYHPDQDDKVKTPEKLFDLYLKSVGRGGCLDLGLSPDKRGRLHDNDVASLRAFGGILRNTFSHDLAKDAVLTVSDTRGKDAKAYGAQKLTDADRYSYWATGDGVSRADVELSWSSPVDFDLIRLRENIKLGQRVDQVKVSVWDGGAWKEVATATSVGSCRLIHLEESLHAVKLRISFSTDAPCLAISEIGVFKRTNDQLRPGLKPGDNRKPMTHMRLPSLLCLIIVLASCSAPKEQLANKDLASVKYFAKEINDFDSLNKVQPDPENAILFTGSSSIKLWSTIKEDMAPYPVIQRGFGGSKIEDLAFYLQRIVYPHKFRAIAIFCGTNNITGYGREMSEDSIMMWVANIDAQIRHRFPKTPIFWIAVTPVPSRAAVLDKVLAHDKRMEAYCASRKNTYFINTVPAYLDKEGKAIPGYFIKDMLHQNHEGYLVWADIIKKELDARLGH